MYRVHRHSQLERIQRGGTAVQRRGEPRAEYGKQGMRYARRQVWSLGTGLIMRSKRGEEGFNKPDLNVVASKITSVVSNRRERKIAYLTEAKDHTLTPFMSLYAPRAASPP